MRKETVLRNREDFERLRKKGKSCGSKYVVLAYVSNGLNFNRHAFLSSKKVGNAVQRNRARRLMRESFNQIDNLKSGYDLLFIARSTISENNCKCADVKKSIEAAIKRADLAQKKQ